MHNYAASVSNSASVMDYPHPTIRVNAAGEMDFSMCMMIKLVIGIK